MYSDLRDAIEDAIPSGKLKVFLILFLVLVLCENWT